MCTSNGPGDLKQQMLAGYEGHKAHLDGYNQLGSPQTMNPHPRPKTAPTNQIRFVRSVGKFSPARGRSGPAVGRSFLFKNYERFGRSESKFQAKAQPEERRFDLHRPWTHLLLKILEALANDDLVEVQDIGQLNINVRRGGVKIPPIDG